MIISIVLYTLFTITFVYYQKYQFMEVRGQNPQEASRMWHRLGMFMRFIVLAAFLIPLWPALAPTIQDIILAGAINIFVWDMGINKIALNVSIWHLGTTAVKDKLIGKHQWKIYTVILAIAILIKIFT